LTATLDRFFVRKLANVLPYQSKKVAYKLLTDRKVADDAFDKQKGHICALDGQTYHIWHSGRTDRPDMVGLNHNCTC